MTATAKGSETAGEEGMSDAILDTILWKAGRRSQPDLVQKPRLGRIIVG